MKQLFIVSLCAAVLGLFLAASPASAAGTAKATLHMATEKGDGEAVGTVTFTDADDGVTLQTDLHGLKPGMRGFHIHEKGSCAPTEKDGKIIPAGAAGGHYDPLKTGKHLGPDGGGHKGDLPALAVAEDGTAKVTMHVKGLTTTEIKNKAIMVHAGGDNYSDIPEALGGGGARIACGVIE